MTADDRALSGISRNICHQLFTLLGFIVKDALHAGKERATLEKGLIDFRTLRGLWDDGHLRTSDKDFPYLSLPQSAIVSGLNKAIPSLSKSHVQELLEQAEKFRNRFAEEDALLRRALERRRSRHGGAAEKEKPEEKNTEEVGTTGQQLGEDAQTLRETTEKPIGRTASQSARKVYDLDAVMWASCRLLETMDAMQEYAFIKLYRRLAVQYGQVEDDKNLGVLVGEPPPPKLEEAVMAVTGVKSGMVFYDLYARAFVYTSLTEDPFGRLDPVVLARLLLEQNFDLMRLVAAYRILAPLKRLQARRNQRKLELLEAGVTLDSTSGSEAGAMSRPGSAERAPTRTGRSKTAGRNKAGRAQTPGSETDPKAGSSGAEDSSGAPGEVSGPKKGRKGRKSKG